MIEHLECHVIASEPESKLDQESARERIRQMRKGGGHVGSISLPSSLGELAPEEPAFNESANAADRFTLAMQQPAVDIEFSAEHNRLDRAVESKRVILRCVCA